MDTKDHEGIRETEAERIEAHARRFTLFVSYVVDSPLRSSS